MYQVLATLNIPKLLYKCVNNVTFILWNTEPIKVVLFIQISGNVDLTAGNIERENAKVQLQMIHEQEDEDDELPMGHKKKMTDFQRKQKDTVKAYYQYLKFGVDDKMLEVALMFAADFSRVTRNTARKYVSLIAHMSCSCLFGKFR